jgi:hypothetical protein
MTGSLRWAIAIPAHDEADRIAACLAALGRQRDVLPAQGAVLVLANNCRDDTARIARAARLPCALHVVEHRFAAGQASAGAARRVAMDLARRLIDDRGIVLTTDADAVADEDWVAAMLTCFADDRIDLVAGRVSADWDEMQHHPAAALEMGALEWRYCNLAPLVEDALDPLPHDPAPRHAQQCGANLALRAAMFDAIGGLPEIPVGEDRALIEAVLRRDGRIRHANAPHVTASARVEGRAEGGMATALRDRIEGNAVCDELVIPVAVLIRRLILRREARIAFAQGAFAAWSAQHGVPGADCDQRHFGCAWFDFVAHCPALAATPLRPADLPAEIAQMERLLADTELRDVA